MAHFNRLKFLWLYLIAAMQFSVTKAYNLKTHNDPLACSRWLLQSMAHILKSQLLPTAAFAHCDDSVFDVLYLIIITCSQRQKGHNFVVPLCLCVHVWVFICL